MAAKYRNGMYKGLSATQEKVFSSLFTALKNRDAGITGSRSLDNVTGSVDFMYYTHGTESFYTRIMAVRVDRNGNMQPL